jgi:hypothetical protein
VAVKEFDLGTLLGLTVGKEFGVRRMPDGTLIDTRYELVAYLGGTRDPLELPMVARESVKEIFRQHEWLVTVRPPASFVDKPSFVWEWAWLDKMGLEHGARHSLRPMPPDWRSSVKIRDFPMFGTAPDGSLVQFGVEELPDHFVEHLRQLGYDITP